MGKGKEDRLRFKGWNDRDGVEGKILIIGTGLAWYGPGYGRPYTLGVW